MRTMTTGTLAVPGATLYYEVRGSGPALLLIPTGNGDAGPYEPLAEALAGRHTVITYDRRGFSRSRADEPVDDARRVDTDAGDAHRLLTRLAGGPAHVMGGSSGAITALHLLARYPRSVRTLVAHEPPLASVLPDAGRWLRFYADLYDVYRRDGAQVAMRFFRERAGMAEPTRPPQDLQPPPERLEAMLARIRRNQVFWFEHEILPYPAFDLDVAALEGVSDRLVLAGGSASREHFPYRPNTVLAERLGLPVVDFPGGHVGYVTHPVEFADALARVLGERQGARRITSRGS
ncbi:alpha/beta hydrolase fold protein [Planomonospora sphaerica]|uniref:Alpha/beta hydrolase fold protein n=1 Tax=Planomonospora sphaerica TaxID=161355 RepID=A0A171CS00_9ACTN|nr:alpha/beta fold hydrolase [Planomonospora sphaerica]GAT67126.1 alpha/beta hydrolase fold protein [Planomonospora sphaerica]